MTAIISRPFSDIADLQVMLNLVRRIPTERLAGFPTITTMLKIIAIGQEQVYIRLWIEKVTEHLIGYAIIDISSGFVCYEVCPEYVNSSLENAIITWVEEQMREISLIHDQPLNVSTFCQANNIERYSFLKQRGFIEQQDREFYMSRLLHIDIPEPNLPNGFAIRPINGHREVCKVTALQQIVFGTRNVTVESRITWMNIPEYDPELDLVVVAPNGDLVAFCISNVSVFENSITGCNVGYIGPVGTHPDFRYRGLARALLLESLRLLKKASIHNAKMHIWYGNTAGWKLSTSVGFELLTTMLFFQKKVE